MNRTIINMLTTTLERGKDHLPKLVFSYNSTINKSTGYSPIMLIFGRSLKLPVDSIFAAKNSPNNQKSYDEFFAERKENIQQAIDIANRNADMESHLNKTTYGRKLYVNDNDGDSGDPLGRYYLHLSTKKVITYLFTTSSKRTLTM